MRSLFLILPALLLTGPAFGQAVTVEAGAWVTRTDNYLTTRKEGDPGESLSHTADLVECLTTPEEVTFDARRLGGLLLCTATVTGDTPYELELALSCDPDSDPMTGTAIFTFGADGTRYSGRVRLEGENSLGRNQFDAVWFGERTGECTAEAP